MARVIFHAEAEAEVDAAFDWYWNESPDAATGFLDELVRTVSLIGRNPRLFPSVTPSLRKAVLQRYPYYLLFRQKKNAIEVIVVAHAKRKPGYWKSRS